MLCLVPVIQFDTGIYRLTVGNPQSGAVPKHWRARPNHNKAHPDTYVPKNTFHPNNNIFDTPLANQPREQMSRNRDHQTRNFAEERQNNRQNQQTSRRVNPQNVFNIGATDTHQD